MVSYNSSIVQSERLHPNTRLTSERITALSLLDATSVNFAPTCAIWLFERPDQTPGQFDLANHFRQSLRVTLDAYPQWCGQLTAVTTRDGAEIAGIELPLHARRFGRVHVRYGAPQDPGVEFLVANSTATLDDLCPSTRTTSQPLWDRQEAPYTGFIPQCALQNPLNDAAVAPSEDVASRPPTMAIQLTSLACGGFVFVVKSAHPLADAQSMVNFVKDCASVSRAALLGLPSRSSSFAPVFNPLQLDSLAAGDINASAADPAIIHQAESLPLPRYDWWTPSPDSPWPVTIPKAFQGEQLAPAGKPMPWSGWDVSAPVSHYVVHLTSDQVDTLWQEATKAPAAEAADSTKSPRISRHDAVLAHIWSCINRSRNLHDTLPVHCNLVLGVRPALNLTQSFMGSPTVMTNIEMTASQLSSPATSPDTTTEQSQPPSSLHDISKTIRSTISELTNPASLPAHLHSVAFEASPQRIWQGFLGQRHIMVTTWARAGLYELDFGLSSGGIRYTEGLLPELDGLVLIKEGPPPRKADSSAAAAWTASGVDVSLHLRAEDMSRLLSDPLLWPSVSK